MIIDISYPAKYYFGGKVDVESILEATKKKFKGRHVSSGCGLWKNARRDIQFSFTKANAPRFTRSVKMLKALKKLNIRVSNWG